MAALKNITIEGPKNANTDPDTGLRFYTWEGVQYPSVTTIRRIAGLPFGLHNWSMSKVIDRATQNYGALGALIDEGDDKAVRAWLRAAATEERDEAADKGGRVHFAAEKNIPLDEVDEDIRLKVEQYHDFLYRTDAEVIWAERQVWAPTYGYAGTADMLAWLTVDGVRALYLLDLKTGKGIYLDHAIQLVLYSGAEFVGEDDVKDDAATASLHAATRMGIVHLADDHWTLQGVKPTPALWRAGIGLLDFARFNKDAKDITGVLEPSWSTTGCATPPVVMASEPSIIDSISGVKP